MEIYKTIGNKIKYARTARGLNQLELGDKIGLSRVSIVNIEKGRQCVTLDKLIKISKVTNYKISNFLEDNGDKLPFKTPYISRIEKKVLVELDKIPNIVLKNMIKTYKIITKNK